MASLCKNLQSNVSFDLLLRRKINANSREFNFYKLS